jgi:hypothetical protein
MKQAGFKKEASKVQPLDSWIKKNYFNSQADLPSTVSKCAHPNLRICMKKVCVDV